MWLSEMVRKPRKNRPDVRCPHWRAGVTQGLRGLHDTTLWLEIGLVQVGISARRSSANCSTRDRAAADVDIGGYASEEDKAIFARLAIADSRPKDTEG